MAASMILTLRESEDDPNQPKVRGRIRTTVAKAKEFRPFIEKLITLARHSLQHSARAAEFATTAERNTPEWKAWRESDQWQKWNQAIAPAVACRRRAFAALRDKDAVSILFETLAPQFADRHGGYTRILKITTRRLGDAGEQALIEFVGNNDRVTSKKKAAPVAVAEETAAPAAPAAEPEAQG